MTSTRALTALAASAALLLAACGAPERERTPVESATNSEATEQAPASTEEPTASGADSSDEPDPAVSEPADGTSPEEPAAVNVSAEGCEARTVEDAVATALADLAPMDPDPAYAWTDQHSDTSAYDPCAPLSAITFTVGGGTASSPGTLALYAYGTYLGPATEGVSEMPTVRRLGEDVVEVVWMYTRPEDSNATPGGLAVSRFRWDETRGTAVRVGTLPETMSPTVPASTAAAVDGEPLEEALIAGAHPEAGGPAPADAVEATNVHGDSPDFQVALWAYEPIFAQCQAYASGDTACSVDSFLDPNGFSYYGSDFEVPRNWIATFREDAAVPYAPFEDAIVGETYDDVQWLNDGDVVTFGQHVCAASGATLTCWSSENGQGFVVADGSYVRF